MPRRALSLVLAAATGIFSFVVTRYIAHVPDVSAQVDPNLIWAEMTRAIQEDERKDRFVGTLAGVEFRPLVTAKDIGCVDGSVMKDALETLVADSRLSILPEYLPPSYVLAQEGAAECSGKVVSAGQYYVNSDGGSINIAKFGGRASTANAPRDRLETLTIGDRTAVLVRSLPLPGVSKESDVGIWRLIIAEDFGITEISASNISLAEMLEISKGVK